MLEKEIFGRFSRYADNTQKITKCENDIRNLEKILQEIHTNNKHGGNTMGILRDDRIDDVIRMITELEKSFTDLKSEIKNNQELTEQKLASKVDLAEFHEKAKSATEDTIKAAVSEKKVSKLIQSAIWVGVVGGALATFMSHQINSVRVDINSLAARMDTRIDKIDTKIDARFDRADANQKDVIKALIEIQSKLNK